MRKILVMVCTALILLVGCSKEEEESPKMLNVDLNVNPVNGQKNEPVTFQAKVTYEDDVVKDADEVMFEVWLANSEDHQKVSATYKKDGIYEWKKSFSEEGTYYVYAHVTARDMHNMPKKEFVIGKPSPLEENDDSKEMDEMDSMKDDK